MRLFLFVFQVFAEDFITKMEYSKLLYSNPRGIGCNKCHGEFGEGSLIAKYKHKGEAKELIAPRINNLSKDKFFQAILNPKSSVMPNYSLTKEEIESLYNYVSVNANKSR
ncbi:MAG: c-type cytochrome [Campylobacteraceae bacterium]